MTLSKQVNQTINENKDWTFGGTNKQEYHIVNGVKVKGSWILNFEGQKGIFIPNLLQEANKGGK